MRGLMMDSQLLITRIMEFAGRNFPDSEVVSAFPDGRIHRQSYRRSFRRARRLANALARAGMRRGDRVGTLAWNDHRHFETYYAVSCSGAVCHTINPRLFPEQIAYIVNHAEDRWIVSDPMFAPLLESIWPQLDSVEGVIFLSDAETMPSTSLPAAWSYEALLAAESDEFDWPELGERTGCGLCYTSGTTGHPKGVLYDHRSTVIHAYAACMADVLALANRDSVLAVVPMFHANAWSLPYACPMVGAKLVLPGPLMGDPRTLADLIDSEAVTVSMGVPTVWLGLLAYLERSGRRPASLERIVVGGAACPESLLRAFGEQYGVEVLHSWGMTEMSPLGVVNRPTRETRALPADAQDRIRLKQGRGIFGVAMRIVDDEDREIDWDGETSGRLQVRGPWVGGEYFRPDEPDPAHREDGWFDTGDVATIDRRGFMQITDRAKDVIKSGGEWISSIELENITMGHRDVVEAAVIGIAHPKWGERPLLLIVKKPGTTIDRAAVLSWLDGRIADWWMPDDVLFVDEIPHTATGKISKTELRARFGDHVPGAAEER